MSIFNVFLHACLMCSTFYLNAAMRPSDELIRIAKDFEISYVGFEPQYVPDRFGIFVDVKNLYDWRLIKTEREEEVLRDSSVSELENNTDKPIKKLSLASDLKTSITESTTVTNVRELSGDIELPLKFGMKAKVGLKFSRSESALHSNTQEIIRKVPSDTVELQPFSKKKIVAQLFTSKMHSTYSLSFEAKPCRRSDDGCNSYFYWIPSSRFDPMPRLLDVLEYYIVKVLKQNSYPVFIRDRVTNETVVEITGPFPDGKIILRNITMDVVVEEPLFRSNTTDISTR